MTEKHRHTGWSIATATETGQIGRGKGPRNTRPTDRPMSLTGSLDDTGSRVGVECAQWQSHDHRARRDGRSAA